VCTQSVGVRLTKNNDPGATAFFPFASDSFKKSPRSFALKANESQENEGGIGRGTLRVLQACFKMKETKPAHHG